MNIILKRVLVPTDLSDNSRVAIRYGVAFVEQFGAQVALVLGQAPPGSVGPVTVGDPVGGVDPDAHLGARGFFPRVDHPDPDIDDARIVGMPWRMAGEGALVQSPPPRLGDANADLVPEGTRS